MRTWTAFLAMIMACAWACDDDGGGDAAGDTDSCSMPLRGEGVHTIAEYDDGYLLLANAHVALREHERGVVWHRLDGNDGGRIDLATLVPGTPQEDGLALIGSTHLASTGWTESWDPFLRVIELSSGRIVFDGIDVQRRGAWLLDVDGVLRSVTSGARLDTGCSACRLEAIDGFGRAWLNDQSAGEVLIVALDGTQTSRRTDVEPWSVRRMGPAVVASARLGGMLIFGASPSPTRCDGWQAYVGADGDILCIGDEGRRGRETLPIVQFDPDGREVRRDEVRRAYRAEALATGFALGHDQGVTWIPFDARQPKRTLRGVRPTITAQVAIIEDGERVTALHGDGQTVTIDAPVERFGTPEVSRSGRFAVFSDENRRYVYDLRSGKKAQAFARDGWYRFVGDVLLHDGAPIGQTPPSGLSNIVFPDARCPATVMEECVGETCRLAVVEYAQ